MEATLDDFVAVYGEQPKMSFVGYAVRNAGKTVAVAGIYTTMRLPIVFSQIVGDVSKSTIVRTARKILAYAKRKQLPLYAVRDPKVQTSGSFIEHFDFHEVGYTERGPVYQWTGG